MDFEALRPGPVLHRGSRSLLQLATRAADGHRVVQKAIAPGVTEHRARQRLRHEHEMLARAQGSGVVRLIALATTPLGLTLVLEAAAGDTLRTLFAGPPMSLATELDVALKIATAVQSVHARGVFHLDINPDHVVVDRDGHDVTLVDFSRASSLPLPVPEPMGRPVEALAWLAPEQTGRIDRLADSRTDLYAVGVLLHWMLARALPLWNDDPLALVHAIVARPAPPLRTRRPDLPGVVCQIVDRLLEKSPDDRYQSAAGLTADLRVCLELLQRDGAIAAFRIGRSDRSGRLLIPSILYGRDDDVRSLVAAVECVCAGTASSVALLGPAGIGKTSVVHEVRAWARAKGGLFAAGKFDQLLRAEAFGPLRVALDRVIRQILALRADGVDAWRQRLTLRLDAASDVVRALFPAMQALLPEAQPGRPLPAGDAQARQLAAVTDLLRALHDPERPLILFVDDMQWADPATLDLVEAILRAPDPRNPVLIFAWRDNEVPDGHPLHALLHRLGRSGPIRITLAPLRPPHVAAMLAAALDMDETTVGPLAARVTERAEGNPFAIREILVALTDAGALRFDAEQFRWTCSLESVDRVAAQSTVVELLGRRLDALRPEPARLLAQMACFGQDVSVELLAVALARPMEDVVRDAAELCVRGLLVPSGEGWEVASGLDAEETSSRSATERLIVRFPHDRVQEAARARLTESERVALHAVIARRLDADGLAERGDQGLFLLAQQLVQGIRGLGSPGERAGAAERLATAATRARELCAFGQALAFAEAALSLRDGDEANRSRAFALHRIAAESAMTLGDRATAEKHVHDGEPLASEVIEVVSLDQVRIRGHIARGEHESAVDVSCAALERLGHGTPRHPRAHHIAAAFARVMWRTRGSTRASLAALPVCRNDRVAASLGIMAEAQMSAYLSEPNLTALWMMELIDRTMCHGITPQGAFALAGYGFMRSAFFNDVEGGAVYCAAAFDVVHRLGATEVLGKVEEMDWGFVKSRSMPLRDGVEAWVRAVRHNIDGGDMVHAGQAATNTMSQAFACGMDLDEIERHAQNGLATCRRIHQDRAERWAALYLQALDNLRGRSPDPLELSGSHIDGEAWAKALDAIGDKAANVSFGLMAGQVLTWLGARASALAHFERARQGIAAVPGTYIVPTLIAYTALAHVAVARESLAAGRSWDAKREIAAARKDLKKLAWWLKPGPVNYVQLRDLIVAEIADATGRWDEAARAYDAAIVGATAADHGFDRALALELAGEAWLRRGHGRPAASYLLDARAAWLQHGVVARIDRFEPLLQQAAERGGVVASTVAARAPSVGEGTGLDATAIARATRVLSAEIRVDALLVQLLRLVVQTAGATGGALLLVRDGKATVETIATDAAGGLEMHSLSAGTSRSVASPDEVLGPLGAVTAYVLRTRESVLLDDTSDDTRFAEVFAARGGAGSVLAAPLLRAGDLVGIVVLEHREMKRAFGAQRTEMVETLAAQAAVSLVNALLYESLDAALDDQKKLTHAYQRFVPQEFMLQLGRTSILDISVGDQVQGECTALFADIRGFTTLAERLGPAETFMFINRYLAAMEPAIYGHNGHVAQYLGDGIMAVFPWSADDAVQGALAMFAALGRFNSTRAAEGLEAIHIGIGINTGSVTVGVIGGRSRMDRGLVGDPVNVASRIEGLCKAYGTPLLIGGDTRARLADPSAYEMRLLDRVIASGKELPVDVYEVLDAEPPEMRAAKAAGRAAYEQGLNAWRSGRAAEAGRAFAEALEACPSDTAARLFVERCAIAEAHGMPAHSDGASRLAWK